MSAYDEGQARGQHWARHAAGAEGDLQNLQELRSGKSDEQWQSWFLLEKDERPAFQRLVKSLRPASTGSPREVSAYWQQAVTFGADLPPSVLRDSEFVRGFADGALAAWRAAGRAGERGSEIPDENWIDEHGGPTSDNDT